MSQPSNQDGQTTCPTCGGDGHDRADLALPYWPHPNEKSCPACLGTGTVPSEAGLGSLPESPQTEAVNGGLQSGTGKSRPDTNAADSLEQEIPRLLFKSGAIWSVDDPKGDLEDELLALIRRREIALLEKMKREWGYGDTGMDWEEWINAELKRLKEGEER